ncbi:MAG: restriction endonuclease subunit S [Ignavibacteriaceae bacterium]|nr:restriction endonuclease subunit S [Ignavibacteriaceae bacterium]
MKMMRLTEIAPYSGKRVQPFDGAKRYMSTGDLKGDNLNFEDVTYKTKPSRADILVSEGDVLFAKMTNTNKALIIDKELDGIIVSTGFSVHRPIEKQLFSDYFLHFLRHDSFQRQKNKLCTGAIQSAISNSGIEKILVPIPQYSEQLHIAKILSKAENLIAQRKESIRLLDEFLKSTFLEMFGDPVRNEKGWEICSLSELGSLDRGVSKARPRNSPDLLGGIYPLIQTGDVANSGVYITTYKQTYSEFGLKQSKLWSKGTMLITIAANIGQTSILSFDACFPDSVVGLVTDKKKSSVLYVHFLFKFLQALLESKASQTAQKNINLEILRNLRVPCPPPELQTQFAVIVEKTEALKINYQNSMQELENLYASLSQKAFRGELSIKSTTV